MPVSRLKLTARADLPCTLIDEAHRSQAVGADFALAALRQERDPGETRIELERVAVAGRPPADLARAAEDAAAKLVAQGRRRRAAPSGRSVAPSRRRRGSWASRRAAPPKPPSSFPPPVEASAASVSEAARAAVSSAGGASIATSAALRGRARFGLLACERALAFAASPCVLRAAPGRLRSAADGRGDRDRPPAAIGGTRQGRSAPRAAIVRTVTGAAAGAGPLAADSAAAGRRAGPGAAARPAPRSRTARADANAGRRAADSTRARRARTTRRFGRQRRTMPSTQPTTFRNTDDEACHLQGRLARRPARGRLARSVDRALCQRASPVVCSRCSTTGTSSRRSSRTWPRP